jgi:large subunit ribosomal protein L15
MNLHSLTNTEGARHRRKRLGRGMASGLGKTSGKGHKGQMARKGNKHKLAFEGGQMPLVRRIPKRGFTNPCRKEFMGVNLCKLDCFEDGAEITVYMLRQAGLANGPFDGVKVLARGEITKKFTIKVQAFSASAREKIEAAGGVCEVVQA